MKTCINLQTKSGLAYYFDINSQFQYSKDKGFLDAFKLYLTLKYVSLEKKLIKWIDEHEMETPHEMDYWKNEAEIIAVLKYFSERAK